MKAYFEQENIECYLETAGQLPDVIGDPRNEIERLDDSPLECGILCKKTGEPTGRSLLLKTTKDQSAPPLKVEYAPCEESTWEEITQIRATMNPLSYARLLENRHTTLPYQAGNMIFEESE
ncbi:MAG: hypothetical protein ABIE22_03090 [archaeon]